MAVEGYATYADIGNGDNTVGDLIGTAVTVTSSAGLFWYLDKAGIRTGGDAPPTQGQGWPR